MTELLSDLRGIGLSMAGRYPPTSFTEGDRDALLGLGSLGEGDRPVILYLSIGWCLFAVVCAARLWPR